MRRLLTNCNSILIEVLAERPIAFNPALARISNSALAGLFLSQLLYWWEKGWKKGLIYKTIEQVRSETLMTRSEQNRAIRIWKELGVLEVELCGLPRRRHFRIKTKVLLSLLETAYGRTQLVDIANQLAKSGKLASKYEQSITESTQENTNKKWDMQSPRIEKINAGRKNLTRRFRANDSHEW
ncbi:MAG TPA: hypothetical protein VG102_03525 [Candidatus Paceibacterota bacterium]|jgi:hypothetical protein|nr:hypothetical protein [Candidatus Paceibacterota bacterium]